MIKEIFQVYLSRLTDLSSRNRLLYLPKLYSTQMIDLNKLDFLHNKVSFDYIRELIAGKKSISLLPISDPRDKDINQLSQNLKVVLNQIQLTEQETGEKSLYVGYPYIEGKLINDQVVRCPLFFFPVSLSKEGYDWVLNTDNSQQIIFNKTFLLAYERAYGKRPISDEEIHLEDFSTDAVAFLTEIYEVLKTNFSINFNQELYEQKIIDFPESSKSEDEHQFRTGILKLRSYAVLGQFSQKSSFLIQDYEELINQNAYNNLEELFSKHYASAGEKMSMPREDQLYNIFPLDASQEEVVKAVKAGQSCVIEGPPGTGKSQLISNLAVDYISRGKKVLIVSQKRAALDVVYKRLEDKGFAAFLALVHDFRANRKSLFEKIQKQVHSIEQYQELNRGINALQLERQFSQLSRTIDTHVDYFDDFKKGLFNTEECGVPIKQLYMTSKMGEEGLDLAQYYKKFHMDGTAEFLRNFKEFESYHKKYQNTASFWLHRVDFSSFGGAALQRMKETLQEIEQLRISFEDTLGRFAAIDSSCLYSLFEQKERLSNLKQHLHLEEVQIIFDRIKRFHCKEFDLPWLENKFEVVKYLLSEEGVEWSIEDGEVHQSLYILLEYIDKKNTWLGRLDCFFNKSKFGIVQRLLATNKLNENSHNLKVLVKKLENRLNLNHQYTLLTRKEWLELPAKPFDFSRFNHASSVHLSAIQARKVIADFHNFVEPIFDDKKSAKDIFQLVGTFEIFNLSLSQKIDSWNIYFSKIQVQHLLSHALEGSFLVQKEQIPHVFDELVAFDILRKRLSHDEIHVMEKMLEVFPTHEYSQLRDLFLKGLSNAWIDHIEAKFPILKEVSTTKFLNIQEELMEAVVQKWELSQYISQLRVREFSFKNLEYNRLNNLVTYRALLHQVSKKRRLWTIKKVIESFEEEIFRLLPCWLVSPDTVSVLFPMKQSFDLVIFDESSQCYVERGLPAMLRGKQVVIAGDSKQLQPFDLYQVRLDSEQEGMEVETDSLLDLASGFFKKFWLKGHYRSVDKSLIQFSNKHFYENKLEMLTDRNLTNLNQTPFELIHVSGVWEMQSNLVEAKSVVEIVKRIQKSDSELSIGIISFNYFQMELIHQLLEEDAYIQLDKISVKNIENVQGDEFDWVIFSIGYAKNKLGRLIANFGLLSKKGGENRLNVAITRAKKKISIVTSITSKDLNKIKLKNAGIDMLEAYLRFVEAQTEGDIEISETKNPKGFLESWALKSRLIAQNNDFELSPIANSAWFDLVVKNKSEGFVGAILTDDQRLYDTSSTKEAYVYHPLQLKQKSWPYRFYFSRQYWMGKDIFGK